MYPYLPFCGTEIPLYNVCIGVGLILALIYLNCQITKFGYYRYEAALIVTVVCALLLGFLGARLIEIWFQGKPLTVENLRFGGQTFLGGLLVGAAVLIAGVRMTRQKLLWVLNLLIPSVALAQVFGRIGCFFGGCCHGTVAPAWIGVCYPVDTEIYPALTTEPLYPTQLFEAGWVLLLFLGMIYKIPFRYRMPFYLAGYGIGRFLIEFMRGDERGSLLPGLSPAQWISVAMFVTGTMLFLYIRKYGLKEPATTAGR